MCAAVSIASGLKNLLPSAVGPCRVLQADRLVKTYGHSFGRGARSREVFALKQVSLSLLRGSRLALIGKSGAGKSTLARCLALLDAPDSGEIRYCGDVAASFSSLALRRVRSKIQLVWQHSAAALNPRLTAIDIVAEPLRIWKAGSKKEQQDRALEMIGRLGLPASLADRTSLEMSGGQRQRIALARALILSPTVLILDEAFAGLDLPLEREITEMLLELQKELSLSLIFITHDLRRAACVSDRIAVMHGGEIVESGDSQSLLGQPKHAATRELVNAMPEAQGKRLKAAVRTP
jgi:peptide/nickel transport system ATP-binding protein